MDKARRRYFPLFVLPTLLAFLIGFLLPFLEGLYLSFCSFTTVRDASWTGLANYREALADPVFAHAFWYTAAFAAASLVLVNVLALAVALLLVRGLRGANLFRTVFFLPNLIGGIVLGYVWQLILNGLLLPFERTLTYSEYYGFWGLLALNCWQQIGYMMIIYIAGLQTIPGSILESAAMDGASPRQVLFRIKLPMLMPSITICTFLTLTGAFKLFDQNLSLTAGEPAKMSEMLALNIYNTFYGRVGWEGVGQAKAVLFLLLVVGIALLQLRLTRTREVQQ